MATEGVRHGEIPNDSLCLGVSVAVLCLSQPVD
jgi:hypothetical protein